MSKKYAEGMQIIWSDKKRILGMPISFTKYTLAKNNDVQKLYTQTGVFSTTIEEVNLYRVYDIKIYQSLWQKIFKTGTIQLYSNDVTSPLTEILNVKKPYYVRNILAKEIEDARDDKNVHIGEIY